MLRDIYFSTGRGPPKGRVEKVDSSTLGPTKAPAPLRETRSGRERTFQPSGDQWRSKIHRHSDPPTPLRRCERSFEPSVDQWRSKIHRHSMEVRLSRVKHTFICLKPTLIFKVSIEEIEEMFRDILAPTEGPPLGGHEPEKVDSISSVDTWTHQRPCAAAGDAFRPRTGHSGAVSSLGYSFKTSFDTLDPPTGPQGGHASGSYSLISLR